MSYTIFKIEKKVNLAALTGGKLDLQCILRFSEGTEETTEQLHYEDAPDPEVIPYEILIPIDAPIELQISRKKADKGTPEFHKFETVTIGQNQGIIIHPKVCHFVKQAGRFMVLKTRGGWKYSHNAATPEGECRYQDMCKCSELCPDPKRVGKSD